MGFNKRPLVLGFNDNTLIPSGLVEVILNLSDNGDVCDTQPSDHQVLAWTGTEWCGSSIQFPAGGGGSFTCSSLASCDLSALSNVCSNGPATNAVLAWNGSQWCPSSLPNTVPPPLPTGSPGDILVVKEGATAFATSLASGTLITNAIADQNIVVDGDLASYVAKNQSSSDGEVLVSRGSGGFTGKIASGTLFDEGIVDKNLLTTTNVKPPNVGMSSDGHMTFRTNATTFGTIASNANARTFLTTDANFENLTNVTGISDTDDIADGSPLFWSKTHGTFSAIMADESDTPGTTQTNFLNLTASGGLTVQGDSVQKSVSSTSVTAIGLNVSGDVAVNGTVDGVDIASRDAVLTSTTTTANNALPKGGGTMTGTLNGTAINASTSVSSASVTGVDVTVGNNLNLSGTLRVPDYTSFANAGLPVVLHSNGGDPIAESNSTSLTEVTSITIPGNTFATNQTVEVDLRGKIYGQGQNLRMTVDFGGTTVLNSQISQGTASVHYAYEINLKITRMGTNKQFITANFVEGGGFDSAAGHGGGSSLHREGFMYEESSATESSDNALDFNVQHSANSSGENFLLDSIVARIIPTPS